MNDSSDSDNILIPINTRRPPGRPKKKHIRIEPMNLIKMEIFKCVKFTIVGTVEKQDILGGHAMKLFDICGIQEP